MPQPTQGPSRTTYTGKIFTIKERDVHFSDGTSTVYEYCERPTSVSVLAFNDKNELLLIKERREGYKGTTWFLPGGRADRAHESVKKAAIRELREETGYTATTIQLVHKKAPSSTLIWDIYLFAAKGLTWQPLPKDRGEDITPHFIPFPTAVTMALDGTIDNEFISYNIIRFNFMRKHQQFQWKKN